MVPVPPQHDPDASGVYEGGALMLARPHRLVGGDQNGLGMRPVGDRLYQRPIGRPLLDKIQGVQNLHRLRRAYGIRFRQNPERMSHSAGRVFIECNSHAASCRPRPMPSV